MVGVGAREVCSQVTEGIALWNHSLQGKPTATLKGHTAALQKPTCQGAKTCCQQPAAEASFP
jgi:hypothetical protein